MACESQVWLAEGYLPLTIHSFSYECRAKRIIGTQHKSEHFFIIKNWCSLKVDICIDYL